MFIDNGERWMEDEGGDCRGRGTDVVDREFAARRDRKEVLLGTFWRLVAEGDGCGLLK